MWHFISDQISQAVGDTFICENAKLLHKQHSHSCYILRSTQKRYFVKLHQSANRPNQQASIPTSLQCEADGLLAIQQTNTIKSPQLICHGYFEENQQFIEYLVLQFVCFKSPNEILWQVAGEQLAKMHLADTAGLQAAFGWKTNNWIGSSEQRNNPAKDWPTFYCQQRLAPMLKQLKDAGTDISLSDALLQQISDFLSIYPFKPSLLHGDLWSGNIGFTSSAPVIFDPAVYLGDREMDLAMAELFGGFAKVFFEAYQQNYPLTDGAALRLPLYQLYPVLNHALMFGGSYIQQANQLVSRIKQEIA